MVASYEQMFGKAPKQNTTSPLEKGDHPELDMSELLDYLGIEETESGRKVVAMIWVKTRIRDLQWQVPVGFLHLHCPAQVVCIQAQVAACRGDIRPPGRVGTSAQWHHVELGAYDWKCK
jgi:hypothetical protein